MTYKFENESIKRNYQAALRKAKMRADFGEKEQRELLIKYMVKDGSKSSHKKLLELRKLEYMRGLEVKRRALEERREIRALLAEDTIFQFMKRNIVADYCVGKLNKAKMAVIIQKDRILKATALALINSKPNANREATKC